MKQIVQFVQCIGCQLKFQSESPLRIHSDFVVNNQSNNLYLLTIMSISGKHSYFVCILFPVVKFDHYFVNGMFRRSCKQEKILAVQYSIR